MKSPSEFIDTFGCKAPLDREFAIRGCSPRCSDSAAEMIAMDPSVPTVKEALLLQSHRQRLF
jgi:hypothetical protein